MPPFHEEQYHRIPDKSSSRTQHKLQLQRLSFLTNDKNYLDHPKNMKRLTKELDRVNREYRFVRRYEDPVTESFKRLNQKTVQSIGITKSSSQSSSNSSSYSSDSFLSRWFAPEDPTPTAIHPTIVNNMKRKTAKN